MTNEENIDCIIMDDAFQHRSIKAGLNILLIDFNRPLYKDYLLPIGFLRESSSNKKRADITIVTKPPMYPAKLRLIFLLKNQVSNNKCISS